MCGGGVGDGSSGEDRLRYKKKTMEQLNVIFVLNRSVNLQTAVAKYQDSHYW